MSSWESEKQRQNYSIYFHDRFICCPVSLSLSLRIKHAVPLKEVGVYVFM